MEYQTKNGWEYKIVSTDGSCDELQLTTSDGIVLDASYILHKAVDSYINCNSSAKEFLVDVEDITEAYEKMHELINNV